MSDKHENVLCLTNDQAKTEGSKAVSFYLITYAKLKCLGMPRLGKIVKQQEHLCCC